MNARPRLVVGFHHAGGSAAMFHPLRRQLGEDIRMVAVNLPGREARMREPRQVDANECIEQLDVELGQLLSEPHILFGHSMGALLAYALAKRRIAAGSQPPDALIVAAYRAPHLAASSSPLLPLLRPDIDDRTLARALVSYGGLPTEVLGRPDWMRLLMPIVRDDLLICASYLHTDTKPLPTNLVILGATNDPLVPDHELAQWNSHAQWSNGPHCFSGGHFFLRNPTPALIETIRSAVFGSHPAKTP